MRSEDLNDETQDEKCFKLNLKAFCWFLWLLWSQERTALQWRGNKDQKGQAQSNNKAESNTAFSKGYSSSVCRWVYWEFQLHLPAKKPTLVPDFTDTSPEVVFSFHFPCLKFMFLLHPTSSSSNDSSIPSLPVPFLSLPFPSSGRKVGHGEKSGVTLLPRNSPGSQEGLRWTRCGRNTGEDRRCVLETLVYATQIPKSFPPQR